MKRREYLVKSKYDVMENTQVNDKIIAKIEKTLKQVDPNSKKSITQLSENDKFIETISEIKEYMLAGDVSFTTYEKIDNLISFCDQHYREIVDKKIELQRQANVNLKAAALLNEVYLFAITREDFSEYEKPLKEADLKDYINKLRTISQTDRQSEEYAQCEKDVKSKIANLEGNLHIEIDLERLEDKEKALNYIFVELNPAFESLPSMKDVKIEIDEAFALIEAELTPTESYAKDTAEYAAYYQDIMIEVKETLWQKISTSIFIQRIKEFFVKSDIKQLAAPKSIPIELELE